MLRAAVQEGELHTSFNLRFHTELHALQKLFMPFMLLELKTPHFTVAFQSLREGQAGSSILIMKGGGTEA